MDVSVEQHAQSLAQTESEENVSSFAGFGVSEGERIIEARFGLRHFNLADKDSAMAAVDARVIENLKKRWELLKN